MDNQDRLVNIAKFSVTDRLHAYLHKYHLQVDVGGTGDPSRPFPNPLSASLMCRS